MRGIDSRKSNILTQDVGNPTRSFRQPVPSREHQSKRPAGRFSRWSFVTALTVVSKRWKLKRTGTYQMSGQQDGMERKAQGGRQT
jgi:hypothetical protein